MAQLRIPALFSVAGKNVLITGGARGIGRMLATGFAVNGAHVYITSRDEAAAHAAQTAVQEAAAEAGSQGSCIALPPATLTTSAGCKAMVKQFAAHASHMDVCIANAGVSWATPLDRALDKLWDRTLALNVSSVFYTAQAAIPMLQAAVASSSGGSVANQSGTGRSPARFIALGSMAGHTPQGLPTYAYDASKAAVHHLVKKLAQELAPQQVTANAIAPGLVPTDMSRSAIAASGDQATAASVPLGRLGNAADVVGAALYLASPAGAWCTGTVLTVDGGMSNLFVSYPASTH